MYSILIHLAIAGMQVPAGAVAIDYEEPVNVDVLSKPVTYQGKQLSIVGIGTVQFVREDLRMNPDFALLDRALNPRVKPGLYGVRWGRMPEYEESPSLEQALGIQQGPFLKAKLKATVAQYNTVDYRISGAVFDAKGRLLGTASHVEKVQHVRLGYMLTLFRDIELDFGASQTYKDAAFAVFTISEPVVPKPPDG